MTKIEAKISEGEIKWTKKRSSVRLEGSVLIDFRCQICYGHNQVKKDLADYDGTKRIYYCEFCRKPYLIGIELNEPVTPKVRDKEHVEIYGKMIPVLKGVR